MFVVFFLEILKCNHAPVVVGGDFSSSFSWLMVFGLEVNKYF